MQIIPLSVGDLIQLKKKHPCGGDVFKILRIGSEVRILCETCSRDLTIDRVKLERSIKQFLKKQSTRERI